MKYFIAIIASTVLLIGCTPKSMKDNTHSVTPVYEETSNAEKLELKSLQEAEALFYKLYEGRDSEDPYTIITSLELMEKYLLNLENFKNPDIYSKGVLAPPFRKLIDLFSYQMVQGIKIKINDPRFEKVLTNYRATVFNACHIGNDDCQTVNPFKGPYGVTILTHILTKDVVRLEKETDKVPEQEIKNIVFSLDVLRSFRESETNLSGNLYIRFAATFFKNVDYNRTKDPFYHDYLQVLLNQMVNQSKAEANPVSCQIFQSIDPLQLQQIGTTLEPGLLTQLTRHYYKCKSPEEISAKLIEIEKNRKSEAIKEVDETSPWSRVYNDFYSRSHSLRKYSRKTLSTFGIQNELPLEIVYFLDRVYYSKINDAERRLVLSKMSQTELIELVGQLEQFAQENYIYAMLFTFATFNNSLEEGYNKFGSINTDFVQNVYDNLWNNMGDTWPDLKEHFAQLRLLLDLIESNLSRENVVSLKEKIDLLRNYRLEKKSIGDLINLTVTFPIVFATNYFAGTNGGGTMKLRFTYVDWMDNNIEIPTTKTLKDFFVGDGRTSLQLLDFGFRNYIPTEYERSVGLSAAIKNGFFDIVNFDIGKENKGTVANLKLLYSRYVEDNNGKYIDSRNALATYETEKDKYWDELVNFCASPISNPRKIEMSSFDRLFILNSKNISDTGGDPMLKHRQYIDSVYKNIDTLYANIEQTKRTYQIIETTLRESGYGVDEFKASALISLKPRFELLSSFIKHRSDYIKAMGTSSNNCLDRITAFQNYQQNLLQLKTAKYLLEVHAGITLLRKLELRNENA